MVLVLHFELIKNNLSLND